MCMFVTFSICLLSYLCILFYTSKNFFKRKCILALPVHQRGLRYKNGEKLIV